MKIAPIYLNNYQNYKNTSPVLHKKETVLRNAGIVTKPSSSNIRANFLPVFTSVTKNDKKGVPICSGFYRDYPTLFAVKKYLDEKFPDGCEIVVGACSTGEDLISLYSMLDDRDKYKFTGIDSSEDAIELAHNNIYGISELCKDSFLLEKVKGKQKQLKERFLDIMSEGDGKEYALNEHYCYGEVTNVYCRVSPEHHERMNFQCMDMVNYKPDKPAGVIFFRNGLYQIARNYLVNAVYKNKFTPDKNDKKEDLRPLIENIHKNLDKNGIFVIGNIPADHIYIADSYLEQDEKVKIDHISLFDNAIDYNMANPEVEIYKTSPLYDLLLEDGRFKPVYKSKGEFEGTEFSVPVIWKKVK